MYDDLIAVFWGVYIFATMVSKGWKFEEGTRDISDLWETLHLYTFLAINLILTALCDVSHLRFTFYIYFWRCNDIHGLLYQLEIAHVPSNDFSMTLWSCDNMWWYNDKIITPDPFLAHVMTPGEAPLTDHGIQLKAPHRCT